ncbi:MAG: type II toxin-antitoxin system PemK/MazF family toxin [Nevskiales bacterium]|nr:type II toxin-antitoxin system PemK/MazF family toxin [Nevskiales bacterium]
MVTPDRGDILPLSFDPASGREMKGDHCCLVLSPKAFNARFGLAWMCPITSGAVESARGLTAITLTGTGCAIFGSILCHQIKALDWSARSATRIDRLAGPALQQATDVCLSILEPARAA